MSGKASRILTAVVVFLALGALSLILRPSAPGTMSSAELSPHTQAKCHTCPPTEQLTGAGAVAGRNEWYVNADFATPPFNSTLRLEFDGVPGSVELKQTGTTWNYSGSNSAASVTSVDQDGNRVVLSLPASLHTNGFAVSTGSGDRIPASGFFAPRYAAPSHFNMTDVIVILILVAAAWYGYKRGLATEMADLIAVAISLVVAAIALRPLSGVFSGITTSPAAASTLAGAILVIVTATLGFMFVPRLLKSWGFRGTSSPAVARFGGAALAPLRQLAVIAMLLALGTQLKVLSWASASITSSRIGGALLDAWRKLYSAG
jgi:uncharacterized membrane protein required for colicin V production